MKSLKERFEEKYIPEPNSGCWLWTASIMGKGYGVIQVGSRKDGSYKIVYAHRVSWELYRSPIPKGKGYHGTCVLHKCDTPSCVNPDHLFLGTHADNLADRDAKGRNGQTNKTHCPQGHEYTLDNTYQSKRGRICLICNRLAQKKYRAKQSERGEKCHKMSS